MDDLATRLTGVRDQVRVSWSDEHVANLHGRMVRRGQARRRRNQILLTACSACACAVLGFFAGRLPGAAPVAEAPSFGEGHGLALSDGSRITNLSTETVLRTTEVLPERVTVVLERAGAHFKVAKVPTRTFRVEAGNVRVTVLGTEFDVLREGAERARIRVTEGRVRVEWPGGTRELLHGMDQVFPPAPEVAPDASVAEAVEDASAPVVADEAGAATTPREWRRLAEQGDYKSAYLALQAAGPQAVRDACDDLLLAADVARLSGHPDKAIVPLQRVLSGHGGDPRAPLAAFTLGRVFSDLGRPREAATAFARSRGHGGPLAEDAFVREIEATWRAGDTERARTLAEQYLKSYPSSRRAAQVRKFGGLE